jgi:hypothetical protein
METVADRSHDPVERDKLHRGLDGRQILNAGTAHDVAARGSDQFIA